MSLPAGPASDAEQRVDVVVHGVAVVTFDVVTFDVVVRASMTEAPRVSVKAAHGARGVVDIIGVEERTRASDGTREIAFSCEAERGAVDFVVDVVVDRPGRTLLHVPGPHVPALGAP